MAKSDALFQLVRSLTPAEKRYFTTYTTGAATGKDKSKYLLLYEAVDQQVAANDEYHEDRLLQVLEGTIDQHNISYEKNYLYQSIMRSLRTYQSERNPKIHLRELLIDIDILYRKGLHRDTLKYIRRAKKIARKQDYNLEYLELCLLERRIHRQKARKHTEELVGQLQRECREKLICINNYFRILDLYEEVFIRLRNQDVTESDLALLKKKIGQVLGRETRDELGSLEEHMYYHLTYSMFYLLTKEERSRMPHLKSLLAYFEHRPHLLEDNQYQERYLSCLNNYVNHCYLYQSDVELKAQINKLQELQPGSRSLKIQLRQYLYYSKMLYYFKRKDFVAVVDMGPEIQSLLDRYAAHLNLNRRLTLIINMAAAYLLEGHYAQAQDQVNLIINEPRFEVRRDIQMLSRIFQILLFYDQQFLDSAEYEVFKAQRYLRKFRSNNRTEKLIINALKKAIQHDDTSALSDLYQTLQTRREHEEICFWLEKRGYKR